MQTNHILKLSILCLAIGTYLSLYFSKKHFCIKKASNQSPKNFFGIKHYSKAENENPDLPDDFKQNSNWCTTDQIEGLDQNWIILDAGNKKTRPSPNDVNQGELGDSWFQGALSALAETTDYKDNFSRLFPIMGANSSDKSEDESSSNDKDDEEVKCSGSWGKCECKGYVRLGLNKFTQWIPVNGNIRCHRQIFGNPDRKQKDFNCYCQKKKPLDFDDADNGIWCGNEKVKQNCECNGQVRYGRDGKYTNWKEVNGQIDCTNQGFGEDPYPGRQKNCFCKAQVTQKALSSTTTNNKDEYKFYFYNTGIRREITINSEIPCNSNNQLIFSRTRREVNASKFWVELLEKAYAKNYGGYENIIGGSGYEAFTDLTGAPAKTFKVKEYTKQQVQVGLLEADSKHWIMTAGGSTGADNLVQNHLYTILGVYKIKNIESEDYEYDSEDYTYEEHGNIEYLVKVRNPWGKEQFDGEMSDKDIEKYYPGNLRKDLRNERHHGGYTNDDDGIFFMKIQTFLNHFSTYTICYYEADFKNSYKTYQNNDKDFMNNEILEVQETGDYYISYYQKSNRSISASTGQPLKNNNNQSLNKGSLSLIVYENIEHKHSNKFVDMTNSSSDHTMERYEQQASKFDQYKYSCMDLEEIRKRIHEAYWQVNSKSPYIFYKFHLEKNKKYLLSFKRRYHGSITDQHHDFVLTTYGPSEIFT